jgi:iron complex outermembrane receptor protein
MKNRSMWRLAIPLFVCLIVFVAQLVGLHAQESVAGSIHGAVTDLRGQAIQGATITVTNGSDLKRTAITSNKGEYAITNLTPGGYTVAVAATGFATQEKAGVVVAAGTPGQFSVSLPIASVAEEVTVEADASPSMATQLAPVKALLDMASPRSEITSQYIRQFTSPVTDFADILQAAPGVVSYSTNGIGNGQAKNWFRGFADGSFTMTWDGVPFQDSNDPTHHSWAYVPAPAISYVDFDRSPGTASDVGPTNFAGSVHMFSPKMGNAMTIKTSESYGSFNTNELLGEFNSGSFLRSKANLWFEGHHMTSDGYQTFNDQQRTAGTLKFNYKFSDKTNLTLVGTSMLVDSNTPDSDPTRQQIADHGLNYVMDGNALNPDGTANSMYYKNFTYHVPTNFEIITFTKELGRSWKLETKPYTYSYSNHQHLQKAQNQDLLAPTPIYVPVSATSAVNKLNQYNRGGEITTISAASRFGVFRAGAWYEYTSTHRYQIKSDPRTWVDSPLLANVKFHEYFHIHSTQPFVEYQLVAIPKLTITAGVKSATYNMSLNQLADGSTVGNLGCTSPTTAGCAGISTQHSAFYNNILPSVEVNYRLLPQWSAYGQYGRGSVIPPSSVFDVTGAQVATTPKPTVASTYQGGTVLQFDRISFDADVYHIHYDNAYSSYKVTDATKPDFGDSYYYATPPSNTTGVEAEGNLFLVRGLSLVMNGTIGKDQYEASPGQTLANGTVLAPTPVQWVASAAKNTASGGVTYQNRGLDLGFFNKRIGPRFVDNSSVHEATQLSPFWMNNFFFNYTVRRGSFFDQTKVKFSVNNLFDNHDVVGLSPGKSPTSTVPFVADPSDQLQLLPGRSMMITFQVGLSRRER